jgi:Domain of Unknown Function (DUF1080)
MRAVCVILVSVAGAVAGGAEPRKWDFEDATVEKLHPDWAPSMTGDGPCGTWRVIEDASAPKGPKVLAQIGESPGPTFNLCVVHESSFKDVEVSVAFKAVKGKVDQGGGIVWRYVDHKNYYIARMNPLESNYRVYKVVAGKRTQLETKEDLKVPAGEWHTLAIKMKGDRIECYLDGKKHLEAKDDTFTKAGKVGVWTKADAQTAFDDFRAEESGK